MEQDVSRSGLYASRSERAIARNEGAIARNAMHEQATQAAMNEQATPSSKHRLPPTASNQKRQMNKHKPERTKASSKRNRNKDNKNNSTVEASTNNKEAALQYGPDQDNAVEIDAKAQDHVGKAKQKQSWRNLATERKKAWEDYERNGDLCCGNICWTLLPRSYEDLKKQQDAGNHIIKKVTSLNT